MTVMLSDLVGQLAKRSEPRTTDGDLLGQFLADRDEQAFAFLVQRHGPLVYGVCRRVTGDHHLAEDAFQAVFVVLAAKAGSIHPRSALPAWLYGVAYRIAMRARTMSDRRLRRERIVETLPERASTVVEQTEVADLTVILDEEIARLPQYQRGPVVLCELEGRSRQEAALGLGISEGTLSSRLARARRTLADRLRRRGVAPSAGVLTGVLAEYGSARVPSGLASKALACATGRVLVPATVATLSQGVVRVMLIQKLKTSALLLAVSSATLACGSFTVKQLIAAESPSSPLAKVTRPALDRTDPPPSPRATAKSQRLNKILFLRNGRLSLIDPDGQSEKAITPDGEKIEWDAHLSPDGKMVAVQIRPPVLPSLPDQRNLYIRTIDGEGPGTDLGVKCNTFVWSADGSEIACCNFTDGSGQSDEITHFIVNVKTRDKKSLNLPSGHLLSDWSPNGKYFLTTRFLPNEKKPQERRAQLYLINRDGTVQKVLTDEKLYSAVGRFSPDGQRVLYARVRPPAEDKGEPKRELAILDIATGKSTVVDDTPSHCDFVSYCWSPDGQRIAYTARQTHDGKLEKNRNMETASCLTACDTDGKNASNIAVEWGPNPWIITIGRVDWR